MSEAVYVNEGWWHPNVKDGRVHDHPERPGGGRPAASHRLCDPVYTQRDPTPRVWTPPDSCPECGGLGMRGCGAAWHDGKPDNAPSPADLARGPMAPNDSPYGLQQ